MCFRDIPVPFSMKPLNIRSRCSIRSPHDILREIFSPGYATCSISSRRIKTFDDVHYSIPLTDCWTVLSKDCRSTHESSYAVLMKKISSDSSQKVCV